MKGETMKKMRGCSVLGKMEQVNCQYGYSNAMVTVIGEQSAAKNWFLISI